MVSPPLLFLMQTKSHAHVFFVFLTICTWRSLFSFFTEPSLPFVSCCLYSVVFLFFYFKQDIAEVRGEPLFSPFCFSKTASAVALFFEGMQGFAFIFSQASFPCFPFCFSVGRLLPLLYFCRNPRDSLLFFTSKFPLLFSFFLFPRRYGVQRRTSCR